MALYHMFGFLVCAARWSVGYTVQRSILNSCVSTVDKTLMSLVRRERMASLVSSVALFQVASSALVVPASGT